MSRLAWLALTVSVTASAQDIAVDEDRVAAAREGLIERMVVDHGFDRDSLTAVLEGATIEQSVLRAISRPVERVVPWYEYRGIFLNEARIQAGAAFWREHADLVREVSDRHGVDPEVILAIVGIESLFGQRMGSYRVLDSLSTLAFAYPPRASFFSGELESFLLMSREEGPQVLDALGSYAGAMGAGQFIPSSYRAYAVDGDGDGFRDLWANWSDILASVANYLDEHGWQPGEPVAVAAERAVPGPAPANGLDLDETVGSLRAAGYHFDSALDASAPAMVMGLEADDDATEYWVGFRNFRVITRYNRSVKYALAAHQLSEAIRAAYDDEVSAL
jgi:membrane-bound lytic murein transglycosylase B